MNREALVAAVVGELLVIVTLLFWLCDMQRTVTRSCILYERSSRQVDELITMQRDAQEMIKRLSDPHLVYTGGVDMDGRICTEIDVLLPEANNTLDW